MLHHSAGALYTIAELETAKAKQVASLLLALRRQSNLLLVNDIATAAAAAAAAAAAVATTTASNTDYRHYYHSTYCSVRLSQPNVVLTPNGRVRPTCIGSQLVAAVTTAPPVTATKLLEAVSPTMLPAPRVVEYKRAWLAKQAHVRAWCDVVATFQAATTCSFYCAWWDLIDRGPSAKDQSIQLANYIHTTIANQALPKELIIVCLPRTFAMQLRHYTETHYEMVNDWFAAWSSFARKNIYVPTLLLAEEIRGNLPNLALRPIFIPHAEALSLPEWSDLAKLYARSGDKLQMFFGFSPALGGLPIGAPCDGNGLQLLLTLLWPVLNQQRRRQGKRKKNKQDSGVDDNQDERGGDDDDIHPLVDHEWHALIRRLASNEIAAATVTATEQAAASARAEQEEEDDERDEDDNNTGGGGRRRSIKAYQNRAMKAILKACRSRMARRYGHLLQAQDDDNSITPAAAAAATAAEPVAPFICEKTIEAATLAVPVTPEAQLLINRLREKLQPLLVEQSSLCCPLIVVTALRELEVERLRESRSGSNDLSIAAAATNDDIPFETTSLLRPLGVKLSRQLHPLKLLCLLTAHPPETWYPAKAGDTLEDYCAYWQSRAWQFSGPTIPLPMALVASDANFIRTPTSSLVATTVVTAATSRASVTAATAAAAAADIGLTTSSRTSHAKMTKS
jgi:hypothetical protein